MTRKSGFIGALFALLISAATVVAEERLILLPFADPNSNEGLRTTFDSIARDRLAARGFEVVSEDSISALLRSLRVRNTAAPIESEIRALGDSLDASLILTGTIHSFVLDSLFTEVSVCARLLRVRDSEILWHNCAALSGGGSQSLFTKPVHSTDRKLAMAAAKRLFATLKIKSKPRRTFVSELLASGNRGSERHACSPIAVIPPVDESEVPFSSDMIGNFLVTSLARRGFNVTDPGRVRNVMLQCEDLRYGQSVNAVSKMLADCLNVALVVTGTISTLTATRSAALGTSPAAAIELRMIDPLSNSIVWAEHLERTGEARKRLFGTGVVHSPAVLAFEMITDAVGRLKVVRRKIDEPIN